MKLTNSALVLLLLLAAPSLAWGEKPLLVLDAGSHTDAAGGVFTPDNARLVTTSADKSIRIWDLKTGLCTTVLRPPAGPGGIGRCHAYALSGDGRLLFVNVFEAEDNHPIYQVDLATGTIERKLRGHVKRVTRLATSPDGAFLASASEDNTVRVWNLRTGKCERILEGHQRGVHDVAWAPDGKRLASAATDGTRLWSTTTGEQLAHMRDAHTNGQVFLTRSVAWSPDGRTIATGSADRTIRLWEPDGSLRKRFRELPRGADSWVRLLAFSGDSRQLWCEGFVLDLETGKTRVIFGETAPATDFSADRTLAFSNSFTNGYTVWDTRTGKVLHRLNNKSQAPLSLGWSRTGTSIAWGCTGKPTFSNERFALERSFDLAALDHGPRPDDDFDQGFTTRGNLSVVLAREPSFEGLRIMEGGREKVGIKAPYLNPHRCWTLLPARQHLVVGLQMGIHLYDLRTGELIRKWDQVYGTQAVAATFDGRYFASLTSDQTIRVWKPDGTEPLLSAFFAGEDWIVWTSEGYYAASPGGERLMGWHVNNGLDKMATFYPAAQFRKTLYRPDVIRKLLEAGSVEKALALADKERGKYTEKTEVAKALPPRVAIVSPDRGFQAATPEIRVQVTATSVGDHPVTALRLLVDGRPYQGLAGVKKIAAPKLGSVAESWTVTLEPGKHRLSVIAESAVSQALSDEVEIAYSGGAAVDPSDLPSLYVLSIGVAAYPGELRLNYAAKDATAVAAAFTQHSKPLFRKVESKLLTNQQATQRDIKLGLSWLRKEMTQRDVAVLFYSGHGMKDSDGRFYLLPVDVDTKELLTTGVADDDVKKALQGMPGRVLAIFDACHAGAAGGDKRKNALTDDLVRDLATDDYGVVMMASSMGREFSLEDNEHRHSKFTLALIEGLSGKAANADGAVYLHRLDTYITDRVKELSQGRQHPVTAKPTSIRSFPLSKPRQE